jgi:creatinine amidohydrolase
VADASRGGAAPGSIAAMTSEALGRLVAGDRPVAVLVPVGSVEPHGPHLGLATDTVISEGAAERAAVHLDREGITALVAPAVAYGVTECAAAFPGAVSIPAAILTAYLRAVVDGYLGAGVAHVCLVNNHLEPAHDRAVRAAVEGVAPGRATVACPLTRRWARTLSDEFKSGACHAGRYETSIVLSRAPGLVDDDRRRALPEVDISLAEKLSAGVTDFVDMGLADAYAGDPARASADEGDALLERLADMVAGEVTEALERA